MRVTLATHGGLAAPVRAGLSPDVVDTDALPESATAELCRLVDAAVLAASAAAEDREAHRSAPDAMSYSVTVEEGGHSSVLVQSDRDMSPEFAALLRWLKEHAVRE
ncbi:protealysin inhibitor emfourin [Streptomyces viridiviolaceus]|uniref:Protealysin inhibitor emfourin n=1 Tax=Streptomyces viridiviolaceus TaxID=68282 RepID=A0ABW2E2Z4_9ACTN|nr:protealysin inhibitor emfourin [Streptomyces viridiviolaceus]